MKPVNPAYFFHFFQIVSKLLCLLLSLFSLSGCFLDDVFQVKKQLNNYDKYFAITETAEYGYLITFKTPVFDEDDVHDYIAQTSPTSVSRSVTTITERYVYNRVASLKRKDSLVLLLTFKNDQKKFRLENIEIPEKIAKFFSKEMVGQCMKTLTTAKRSGFNASIDISKIDLSYMPNPAAIRYMFGIPDSTTSQNRIIYKYQYKALHSPTATLQITMSSGLNAIIELVSLYYGPIEIKIDLGKKMAVGHLKFFFF